MVEKGAMAGLELRHVRHATFEELSDAGYSIQLFDDGATPLQMDESMLHNMPDHWNQPDPVIAPKVATLKGATLFHDGSALLPDGRYSNFDPSYRIEPWRNLYQPMGRSVMRCIDTRSDANDALIAPHPKSVPIAGRCFAALHNFSENYGQFVHDVLSRIYYEDLGAISPGREKIIAPEFVFPMQKLLFEKIFADYEIVHARLDTAYEVEELVLRANLCSSTGFNRAGISALAKRMPKIKADHAESGRRKICVSRRDGTNDRNRRNFANIEAFETRMEKLGYQVVEASKIDPETQFALWAGSTDIVGVHGAGLMNLIMMPSGSGFTEIAGGRHPLNGNVPTRRDIARCAMAFEHRVNVMAGTWDSKFRPIVDLDQLEAILSES